MRPRPVCWTLLAVLVWSPITSAAQLSYVQLVEALSRSPNAVRVEFALTALAQLESAYAVEAARAADAAAGWRRGVDSYRASLVRLARGLDSQSRVSLRAGHDRRTQLLIDDTVVIVSSPRAARQARLERQIMERFCALYLCHQLVRGSSPGGKNPIGPSFGFDLRSDAGLSCNSGESLEFLFYSRDHVDQRRRWCQAIVAELKTLGWALRRRVEAGVRLQWQHFSIDDGVTEDDPVAGLSRVTLNGAGDALYLPLPTCAASPRLIARLLPWLSIRAEGSGHQGIELVITNAEALIGR